MVSIQALVKLTMTSITTGIIYMETLGNKLLSKEKISNMNKKNNNTAFTK